MGLFSTKYITYVDAVAYNMAGDYHERTNFMKVLTVGGILQKNSSISGSKYVTNGIVNGTYRNQSSLLLWAKKNYSEGIPLALVGGVSSLDPQACYQYIRTLSTADAVTIHNAEGGPAIGQYWARQWVYANFPTYSNTAEVVWTYEVMSTTPGSASVRVTVAGHAPVIVPMPGYDDNKQFAYITYVNRTADPTLPEGYYNDSPFIMQIYAYGSGNPIMEPTRPVERSINARFMPFLPVRIDNVFIDEGWAKPIYYEKARRFYKKASGGKKIEDLIKTVKDNDSIDDIDFAFMMYGVSLNTKSQSSKRYLWEFFRSLVEFQSVTASEYDAWNNSLADRARLTGAMKELLANDGDPWGDRARRILKEYNALNKPNLRYNTISQKSQWLPDLFQLFIHWVYIQQSLVTGNNYPERKVGEVWLERVNKVVVNEMAMYHVKGPEGGHMEFSQDSYEFQRFNIFKKISNTVTARLFVVGAKQQNIVYNGKDIVINSDAALMDSEESSFVVPIHMESFRRLRPVDRNQVGCENQYMLFNCYTIVKQRWYQRGIFKLVFAIVIAIIGVLVPPIGGAALGIFGTAASVGAAIGITGTLGAMIGAAVNAIAAMVIMTLVQKVTEDLFGGALGALIGFVLTFVAGAGMSNFLNSGSFAINWSELININNLLKFTDALGRGYIGHVQENIASMQNELAEFTNWAENEMKNIQQKMMELFGMGNLAGLPTDIMRNDIINQNESSATFTGRTLMTGMDLAEMSNNMIGRFAAITTALPDAIQ